MSAPRSAIPVLVRLHADVVRGRWRRAIGSTADAAGVAAGGLAALLSGGVLALTALLFGYVGQTLLASLLATGRDALASGVAGLFADGGLAVALAAVALTDPLRSGLDPRPLSVLPVRPTDRTIADVAGILVLHPVALVAWPVAAALLASAGSLAPGASVLLVPAATGLLFVTAACALALRRVLAALSAARRGIAVLALRTVVLAAPLGWLALGRAVHTAGAPGDAAPLLASPGAIVARAYAAAAEGHGVRALAWGAALHAIGLATLVLAAGLFRVVRQRPVGRAGSIRPRPLRELARLYGPLRAGAMAGQGLAGAAVVLLIGAVVESRLGGTWPAVRLAACFGAWLLVSSIAPLASNVLGLGAPACLGDALLPERAARTLGRAGAWLALPPLAAGALLGGAAATLTGRADDALALVALAGGLVGATLGAGSLCSVLWPWPVRLDDEADPVWPPGPSRLVMTAAHAAVLGAALPVAMLPVAGPFSWTLPLAAGLFVGGAGFVVAARRLDRRRWIVTEALLR